MQNMVKKKIICKKKVEAYPGVMGFIEKMKHEST